MRIQFEIEFGEEQQNDGVDEPCGTAERLGADDEHCPHLYRGDADQAGAPQHGHQDANDVREGHLEVRQSEFIGSIYRVGLKGLQGF